MNTADTVGVDFRNVSIPLQTASHAQVNFIYYYLLKMVKKYMIRK